MRKRLTSVLATAALTMGLLPMVGILTQQAASAAGEVFGPAPTANGQGTSYGPAGTDDARSADTSNTLTGTLTFGPTMAPIRFIVESGPDAGQNGACTTTVTKQPSSSTATDGAATYSCSV